MNVKTKAKIASSIEGIGLIVAAPFLLVGAAIVVPIALLAQKIHSCSYSYPQWDPAEQAEFATCTTCGKKIEVESRDQ